MHTLHRGLERTRGDRHRASMILGAALLTMLGAMPAPGQVDADLAGTYFDEVAALCEREGGRLWGISLAGPMVVADPVTSTIATSEPVPDAPRPPSLGYANAAMEWGGVRWSTFVWPMLPHDDAQARRRLFMHELFHRVQPELGLYVSKTRGECDHLDTLDGRVWIQLEWRALTRALASHGDDRREAVADALAFRSARHRAFPGSAEIERASEINEGLAQYTGTVTAADTHELAIADAVEQLRRAPEKESVVRTFAYPSGAAYGLLLDAWSPGWTRRMTVDGDLGRMVRTAADIPPSADVDAAADRYDVGALRAAEIARAEAHERHVAELRRRFVEGPVLSMPRGRRASFVTSGVTPIPDAGTVYPSYRVTAHWGRLEADEVLVSLDGNTLTVPGPATVADTLLSGDGWTIRLVDGWTVRPGSRAGDLVVTVPDD